jgi:hypothetical protein
MPSPPPSETSGDTKTDDAESAHKVSKQTSPLLKSLESSWSLLAQGDARPGRSTCTSVTVLAGDGHAVILDARSI